jgi:hypothetical protein
MNVKRRNDQWFYDIWCGMLIRQREISQLLPPNLQNCFLNSWLKLLINIFWQTKVGNCKEADGWLLPWQGSINVHTLLHNQLCGNKFYLKTNELDLLVSLVENKSKYVINVPL